MATRKTPHEQIEAARQMLARAQARQRQSDTRTKIVLGALSLTWFRADPRAARAFLIHLDSYPLREQDQDALSDIIASLRASVKSAQSSESHSHAES